MPTLAELNAQELGRLKSIFGRQRQVAKQLRTLIDNAGQLIRDMDRNNNLLPSDRLTTSYVTDDLSAPTRREYNRLRSVMEDLYAMFNSGNGVDGSAHTRETANDAELRTWFDDYYKETVG